MANILIACEESQAICKAFREKGHNAYSCDLLECSGGHPEFHICADVIPLVNGNCTFKTMDSVEHTIEGKAIIRIFNFRWEEIKSFEVDMADTVSVEISEEISQELLKGIYNCSVDINNERVYYQAPLIVK